MKLEFVIFGAPQPKQRARVTSKGTFTPAATRRYEKAVRETAWAALHLWRGEHGCLGWPEDGEYELECKFYMPDYRLGDLDNLGKAISDGLEGAGYENDRQVSKVSLVRVYGDANPRTEVTLTWLGPKPQRVLPKRRARKVA